MEWQEERAERKKKQSQDWKRKRDQSDGSEISGSNAVHRIFQKFPNDAEIRKMWPAFVRSQWMENTPQLHEFRKAVNEIPTEEEEAKMIGCGWHQ